MLDITLVSKLGGLDIVFGMQTDALIASSSYFGIARSRYCGYLGHLFDILGVKVRLLDINGVRE